MIYIDVQNPISTQQQFVNADKFRIVISNVAVLNCRIPPFRYLHFTNVSERIWDLDITNLHTFSFSFKIYFITSLLLDQNKLLDVDAFCFAIPLLPANDACQFKSGKPAPPGTVGL